MTSDVQHIPDQHDWHLLEWRKDLHESNGRTATWTLTASWACDCGAYKQTAYLGWPDDESPIPRNHRVYANMRRRKKAHATA